MWFTGFNLDDDFEEAEPKEYPCILKATAMFNSEYIYKLKNKEEYVEVRK